MNAQEAVAHLESNETDSIHRLFEWLKIPSISTDPAYAGDVRKAAEWAAERLTEAGLDPQILPTGTPDAPGHPIVWAVHEGDPGYTGPHVLFYGHYDVQPPDPLDLWESPPFEPIIKEADGGDGPGDRVVARGAVDDKGQTSTFLEALLAWKRTHGSVPIKLTVMLEGEEESGSVNLPEFVRAHRDHLATCDICVISDTGQLTRGEPAITYGVRGLAYTEVKLHGPDHDLHSGLWGGRCPNPISELVKTLATLWDEDRRVTIPGFYDDVLEPTPEERRAWDDLPLDYPSMLKGIGVPPEGDVGEAGWTALEREWARPACDVNGIWGGYTGAGAKTVIPSWAAAKVSFRLVANQDPGKVAKAFEAWLHERTPPGCRWEFHDHSGGFPGNVSKESPYLQAAERALAKAADKKPHLIKTGGSIPVVGLLKDELDLDTLLIGFGLEDDRMHSPNEKFELDCWRLGARTHAHLIQEFAEMNG
jgi:acetylornithine deacetylase/succinyl-diaminopimelate desuccinylase-like protein